MTQTIDALKLEQRHADDFVKSQQIPMELSSQHNYSDGMTYFYARSGDIDLGYFCRNPWGDGWITFSNYDGERAEAVTQNEAIKTIQASWQERLC